MQISNYPQNPVSTTPSFKAIKSVRCEGLYEKSPQFGKELVDAFKSNPKAMEFCKKFDVDIVFFACKKYMSAVESSVHIFFENPAKHKFLGIFGSKRDEISISNYDDEYVTDKSLIASTQGLKKHILPSTESKTTGVLDSNIDYKEKEIQKVLDAKAKKVSIEEAKKEAKNNNQKMFNVNKESLEDSISDLIKSSK